jgi:putative spermidine/putrescine transport system permease protein
MNKNGPIALAFNALVITFMLAPLVVVCVVAFTPENTLTIPTTHFSLRWFRAVFAHPDFMQSFWNSLWLALSSATIATLLAVPAGMAITRYEFPGRDFLNGLFLSPLIVPHLVLGVALLRLFALVGGTGSFGWLVMAHALIVTPYTLRLVVAALVGFDRSAEQAALSLGASQATVFRRITLPMILPGVTGGWMLAFINSFDEVTMSIFVTSPSTVTLPVRMYMYATESIDPLMAAVSALMVAVTACRDGAAGPHLRAGPRAGGAQQMTTTPHGHTRAAAPRGRATGRERVRFTLDGAPCQRAGRRHGADRRAHARRPAAPQRIQRTAARRLLHDGRLPGLLDRDRRGRAAARLLDLHRAGHGAGHRKERRMTTTKASELAPRDRRRRPGRRARRANTGGARPAARGDRRGPARRRTDLPAPAPRPGAAHRAHALRLRVRSAPMRARGLRCAAGPHRPPARQPRVERAGPGARRDAPPHAQHRRVPYSHLIVATGATDRVLPVPGWTLPGVYTLGGAQVALKFQGCAIGQRVVFMGTGPLLYLVAYQYAKAGVERGGGARHRAPGRPARRHARDAVAAGGVRQGRVLRGLAARARRGAARRRAPAARARRRGAGPRHRRGMADGHEERTLACDAVGFGYALRSETQLADLLGCRFDYAPMHRAHLPVRDAAGRASVQGVYLAGDGAGIMGADAAEWAGERAALALLADSGCRGRHRARRPLERKLDRLAGFRRGLERAFPIAARLGRARARRPRGVPLRERHGRHAAPDRRAERRGRNEPPQGAVARGHGPLPGPHVRRGGGRDPCACHGQPLQQVGRLRGQAPIKPIPMRLVPAEGDGA